MSTGNSNNVSPSASPGLGSSNAPKYGTLVPNRVFVGGISPHTTEAELHQLFSSYGNVKATKIIQDRAGVSKGYGFVTFETEDEARRLQNEGDNIIFKDRKLNIAPAVKKQPFSRMFDPSTASPTGTVLFHNGMPYTYQNGMAVFPPQEYGGYPTQPQYPVMYSQPVIMPQQNFQYQANQPQWPQSNSHWRWTAPAPLGYAPQPPSSHQYVYAHAVPPSPQSAGVQVITIPPQQVAPAAGEFYVSQPPPVYHHQEAQAAATAAAAAAAAAEHDYQQEMQRARYASPCKPPLSRGGYICGPRTAGVGRCGLKQPDLGGAGDAPPPRGEQTGPMTPPPTPGRGDQPVKVDTAATRLQTMTL